MSAFAFTVTPQVIFMLSDGMAMREGSVHCLDHCKIGRITHRAGIAWLGAGGYALRDQVVEHLQQRDITNLHEMALAASDMIREGFTGCGELLEDNRIWIAIMGYNESGDPEVWQIDNVLNRDNGLDTFAVQQGELEPGQCGSMVYGYDYNDADFARLLTQEYLPKFKNIEQAARVAFDKTLEIVRERGGNAGGKQYMTVLTARRVPELSRE